MRQCRRGIWCLWNPVEHATSPCNYYTPPCNKSIYAQVAIKLLKGCWLQSRGIGSHTGSERLSPHLAEKQGCIENLKWIRSHAPTSLREKKILWGCDGWPASNCQMSKNSKAYLDTLLPICHYCLWCEPINSRDWDFLKVSPTIRQSPDTN
jgi:hypothetical protein